MRSERQAFYDPQDIFRLTRERVAEIRNAEGRIDFMTFVSDGEPTLDINLEEEIGLLKQIGIPIAVITNSSLVWQQEVRNALMEADCVSLKFDTIEETVWRRINRPHDTLQLASILEGTLEFARSFRGKLITETMLINDINDAAQNIREVADFLSLIQPSVAYLSIPTRPPAERWARPPNKEIIVRAYQLLKEKVECVELLVGYEGNDFASTRDTAEGSILSIAAVHPIRDDAMKTLLGKTGANWGLIRRMIMHDQLMETEYRGHKFYLRKQ